MICFILYQQEFELPVTADISCSDWYKSSCFIHTYIFFYPFGSLRLNINLSEGPAWVV